MTGIFPNPVQVRQKVTLLIGATDLWRSPADADVSQAWSLAVDFLLAVDQQSLVEVAQVPFLSPYPNASLVRCFGLEQTMAVCDLLRPSLLIFYFQNLLMPDYVEGLNRLLGPRPWLSVLLYSACELPGVIGCHRNLSRSA